MKDLENLISCIETEYETITDEWMNSNNYISVNMKYTNVFKLYSDENLLLYIFKYRSFINDRCGYLSLKLQSLSNSSNISCRVKNLNSIQFKIENYKNNHECGQIPINKCLNDIYGIRIILKEEIPFVEIKEFIMLKYPNLKCIDSSKGDYHATHIYFEKGNNHKFQWELQVWCVKYEKINYLSHSQHKQQYTKWEKESKGGI